ncbi:MAG: hypothetical protein L6V84_03620 [Oscillospiraceae bacterium]|nr:MAG: hypothetical protein L6V84_03620 [Oscillospiraceae bacterium]
MRWSSPRGRSNKCRTGSGPLPPTRRAALEQGRIARWRGLPRLACSPAAAVPGGRAVPRLACSPAAAVSGGGGAGK